MATAYAQTNLQLQSELGRLGYSVGDQEYLGKAYGLAADLFSGQYRGSGKPFVAHLVGTASILANLKAPATVIAAGLLHAAYDQGDFGLGLLGRHRHKRAELEAVLGAEAEDYIQRYFTMRWTDDTIASVSARAASLSPSDRHVVVIRLANELEDYLDDGVLFCANSGARLERLARVAGAHVALARQLGQVGLAEELEQAFGRNMSGAVPPGVRSPAGHSRLRVPRSYRRRYLAVVRAYLASS
jgi:(p)ppGpp synthase/HD superfamily hydrolase